MTLKIFPIYKEKGPTSHDIVNQVRRITGVKKVGHGGTLDPLAKGVLVIAVGRESTREIEKYVRKEKEYIADILLGQNSTTDDAEGDKSIVKVKNKPTRAQVEEVLQKFLGTVLQTPPDFSAVKVKGQSAYKKARQGNEVKLEPKKVQIKDIEMLEYKYPKLRLRVETGPGVYIRALARDLGEKLGTGGYLADLERTKVGEFTKDKAQTIEEFAYIK